MRTTYGTNLLFRRILFLLLGLLIMAFGTALSIKAGLGISPVTSLPYVVSLHSPLTVGEGLILLYSLMILLQILLLRRRYRPIQLLQLAAGIAIGYMTDFANWVLRDVGYVAYWQQWALCLAGIALVAVGVSFEVTAEVVPLAGEGLVLAICSVSNIQFGTMKVLLDVSVVASAFLVSLIVSGGVEGVREGTVAAAILVGLLARRINIPLARFRDRYLCPAEEHL